jgi:hypothetical protein
VVVDPCHSFVLLLPRGVNHGHADAHRVDFVATPACMTFRPFAVMVTAAAVAAIAPGCGRESTRVAPATTAAPAKTVGHCKGSRSALVRARKTRRLTRDVVRLRVLAAPIRKKTLDGTPELSRAVDRFLLDVADRDVPVRVRSRFIDRAAAIVSPLCEQCFQALEASRPIAGGAKMSCG